MKSHERDDMLIRIDQTVIGIKQDIQEIKTTDVNQWEAIGEVRRDHSSTQTTVKGMSKLIWGIITCVLGLVGTVAAKMLLGN